MRVTVIGAGVVGVTTAYALARRGCQVTVVERGSDVACATSHANAGMLTPSMADPWNAPGILGHVLRWLGREDAPFLLRLRALPSVATWGLDFLRHAQPARFRANMEKNLRLARYSLACLQRLRDELGIAYDARANGTIKVFRTQSSFDDAVARNRVLADFGLDVRVLARDEVVVVEPSLAPASDGLVGGIHCPSDESGDACMFSQALASHARTAGVDFHFGTDVTAFVHDARRVTALQTTRGSIATDAVVAAAGCWTPALLEPLGLRLAVRPVKGYSITVPVGTWTGGPRMPVIDDALHTAVTPLGARLRVAGTAEIAGYDTDLTPARIENLYRLLLTLYPSFASHLDRARALPWTGLRPVSSDGVPHLGRAGLANLYLNAGHGHLGWTLACGSAELVADLVTERKTEIDPLPYAALRRAA